MQRKRIGLALAGLLLAGNFIGCATRSKANKLAVQLLRETEFEALSSSIEFSEFLPVGGSATAEGTVKTAFRFSKERNKWVLKEVRIGESGWESVRDMKEALDAVRARRTREDMHAILAAAESYRSRNGANPQASNFVDLIDKLSPAYLARVIRLDGWGHEFRAAAADGKLAIVSAGPDGKENTADDIRLP